MIDVRIKVYLDNKYCIINTLKNCYYLPVKKNPASANISGVCSMSFLQSSNVAIRDSLSSKAACFALYICKTLKFKSRQMPK